jgi:hypothetical protein
MRQHQRFERGSANWPFIITLILFLVFGYMWFTEKDDREKAEDQAAKAEKTAGATRNAFTMLLQYTTDLSQRVGWATKAANDIAQKGSTDDQNAFASLNQQGANVTDLDLLDAQLAPNGNVQGEPGFLNWLKQNASQEISQAMRSGTNEEVTATPVTFDWMTAELRQKLIEVASMHIPVPPVKPDDEDDEAAMARYRSEMEAYEEAVKGYQKALDELAAMPGYQKVEQIIHGPEAFNPETASVVKLDYFSQPPSANVSVEVLLGYPKQVISRVKSEFKTNKESDATVIAQLREDSGSKAESLQQAQTDLATEQQKHVADNQQLQGELSAANERADRAQLERTNAEQRVAVLEDEKRRGEKEAESQINALQNRIRVDKEKRDLAVRRNDPDGHVTAADMTLGTGVIDLGSQDKVFPGLKFEVSRVGRGGERVTIGHVMVIQALGRKSSRVRILDSVGTIVTNDLIANPFYSPNDQIHIVVVGELQPTPEIARARLAKMNVQIDSEVNGDTDYIVIPDDLAAPVPAAAPAEGGAEGGEGNAAPGASEFEKIDALARKFGATVVTQRMLQEFLSY